jgi:hypothetical protein
MSVGRLRLVALVVAAAAGLAACGAAPGPGDPTTGATPSSSASPSSPPSPSSSASPSSPASPDGSRSPTGTGSGSPTALSGLTLRQLGFSNGPEEFTLPSDLVLATRVDQPNVVTVVLARPSPQTVEDYLRATLPGSGFTIDARADAGQAMTFVGHGWTGAFTGTGTTTAIVLRPA